MRVYLGKKKHGVSRVLIVPHRDTHAPPITLRGWNQATGRGILQEVVDEVDLQERSRRVGPPN